MGKPPAPLPRDEGARQHPAAARGSGPVGFNPDMLRNDYVGPEQPPQSEHLPPAPEPDRCTVRCTGVPLKLEEREVLGHFQGFGKVICMRKVPPPPTADERKAYNEFLVQFEAPESAHRCVNSPKPVLENRFIRLYAAPFNLVALSEVPRFLAEGRDAPVSARREEDKRNPARESHRDKGASALKQKYDDLLQLRASQEEIYRRKEAVLTKQMDEFRGMIAKVSGFEAGEAKRGMIESLEGRLLDAQSKLRALEEDKLRTSAPAPGAASAQSLPMYGRGGRGRGRFEGGRGRGRGRFARGGGNLSLDTRPKTLLVSGAPADFENQAVAHFSRCICRLTALLCRDARCRFGQVTSVRGVADGGVTVEFAKRGEAELAKARGIYYRDEALAIDWKQEAAPVESEGGEVQGEEA